MNEQASQVLYGYYDSLSPYEIAILALTSPRELTVSGSAQRSNVITTLLAKEAYLWAGAMAHVVQTRPESTKERLQQQFEWVFLDIFRNYDGTSFFGQSDPDDIDFHGLGTTRNAVGRFLSHLGMERDYWQVFQRTDDAVRSLIWRGVIEDPFSKRIGGVLFATFALVPVSYTSSGARQLDLNALTWEYVQYTQNGVEEREIRVKVKEIATAMVDQFIPDIINTLERLATANQRLDSVMNPKPNIREVQRKLAHLGYYDAAIDGLIGPKLVSALARFQQDNGLRVTKYLDRDTLARLRGVEAP